MGKSAKRLNGPRVKHSRIISLRCHETVHEMMCAGYPLPAIANLVQGKMQECLDMEKLTVGTVLWRYREDLKE